VLGIIVGVLLGANGVNAALPLPDSPAVVDPGPLIPNEPLPTDAPQPLPTDAPQPLPTDAPVGPGESPAPIRTLPPLESPAPAETAAPVEPGPVAPGESVAVGAGFVLYPPAGWTSVGSDAGIVLQKGGVLVIAAGLPWDQSPADLAVAYRDAWFAGGQFTGGDPESGQLGSGIPAAGLNYTGLWNGAQVDGAIIGAALERSGLILNIVGPSGTLTGVSDDLDTLLGTIQHTGG
jgi:hypothetical protein